MIDPLDEIRTGYRLKLFKPGASYLFEGWFLRDKNIDGIYPVVTLFGRPARLSDFWASGEWRKESLVFQAPQTTAPDQELEIAAPRGDYSLWVDDLSLREIGAAALTPKDGSIVRSSKLRFIWRQTPTDRLFDSVLALSRNAAFDGPDVRRIRGPGLQAAAVTGENDPAHDSRSREYETVAAQVPNDLDKGTWFWRIEISQYRTHLAVSETRRFVNQRKSPERDEAPVGDPASLESADTSRLLLDPAFPIGMFKVPAEDFSELKGLGFDAVTLSGEGRAEDDRRALAAAQTNGIRVLASPRDAAWIDPKSPVAGAVLAWYLEDEPEGRGMTPRMVQAKRISIFEMSFHQPSLVVLNRSWRANDYAPACDILMVDPYPVPFEPLSWLGECLDEAGAIVSGDPTKRVWAVVQAFGWNDGDDSADKTERGREPTDDEVKALTYLALVHRASGVFYYVYQLGAYALKDRTQLWEAVKTSVREMRRLMPVIRAPETSGRPELVCDKKDGSGIVAIHASLRACDGGGTIEPGNYLLAVSALNEPVKAEFRFSPEFAPSQIVDFFSGQRVFLLNNRLHLEFAPFERKILFFAR